MSNVINFDFEQQQVDVVEIEGEAWFVASDIAKLLGYAQTNSINKLVDDSHRKNITRVEGGNYYKQSLISDLGIYSIILSCRKTKKSKIRYLILNQVRQSRDIIKALIDFEVPEDIPNMYVYAIREKESRRIKLGISRNPKERLKQLQTGNSQELELIATKKTVNGFEDEALLHKTNEQHAIRGEWFSEDVDTQYLVAVQ